MCCIVYKHIYLHICFILYLNMLSSNEARKKYMCFRSPCEAKIGSEGPKFFFDKFHVTSTFSISFSYPVVDGTAVKYCTIESC